MTSLSFAETSYVAGIQKVTFRKGPGTDSKILKMIKADSPITIVEKGEEWTKVKDVEGDEGYILNRFLIKNIPGSVLYKWLKKKHGKLEKKYQETRDKRKSLLADVNTKNAELDKSSKELILVKKSYTELKNGSAKYLDLLSKFKRINILLDDQNSKVIALEARQSKVYIYWFLAGAGVLFIGWVIGLSSKKKKHGSQLSF